jgi:hypothetical protein
MESLGSEGTAEPVDDDDIWTDPSAEDPQPPRRHRLLAPFLGLALILIGVTAVVVAVANHDDATPVAAGPRTPKDRGERAAPTTAPSTTTATEVLSNTDDSGTKPDAPARTKPDWPKKVGGRPLLFDVRGAPPEAAHDPPRCLYLWGDFDGWHLWAVGAGGSAGARGTVTSDVDVARANLASPGRGSVTTHGPTITFDLSGAGDATLGIDFNPGYFAKRLELHVEGGTLPLCLGQTAKHARAPLVVAKSLHP